MNTYNIEMPQEVKGFDKSMFPEIRRMFPDSIVNDLVSVQPISSYGVAVIGNFETRQDYRPFLKVHDKGTIDATWDALKHAFRTSTPYTPRPGAGSAFSLRYVVSK